MRTEIYPAYHLPGSQILTVLSQTREVVMAWENDPVIGLTWPNFLLCRSASSLIVFTLASRFKLSTTPVLLRIPGLPSVQHCYLFESSAMSSQPAPVVSGILKRAVSAIEDHMATLPSGSIAEEPEFADWGKMLVKKMVRRFRICVISSNPLCSIIWIGCAPRRSRLPRASRPSWRLGRRRPPLRWMGTRSTRGFSGRRNGLFLVFSRMRR